MMGVARENLDAGHNEGCAYGAGGDCTCGRYPWHEELEDRSIDLPTNDEKIECKGELRETCDFCGKQTMVSISRFEKRGMNYYLYCNNCQREFEDIPF